MSKREFEAFKPISMQGNGMAGNGMSGNGLGGNGIELVEIIDIEAAFKEIEAELEKAK